MRLLDQSAVEPVRMAVGDHVKLANGNRYQNDHWWRVQAVSEHFVACVQQIPFEQKGSFYYTVLDWRNGVRGPCDLIGQGWGEGVYDEAECAEMLEAFEARDAEREYDQRMIAEGHTSWPAFEPMSVQVSHRNRVVLAVVEVSSKK